MSYKLANRLLKKNGKRVFWGHVTWAAVIAAVGVPASYLFAIKQQQAAFDPTSLMEYWSESAQASPATVVPPREVADLIFPYGEREPQSSSMNGYQIWTVKYPVVDEGYGLSLLPEIGTSWRGAGFDVQQGERDLIAQRYDGLMLLAKADGDTLEIHCWRPDGTGGAVSGQLFLAHGLPEPPPGSEIMNFSSPDSASALAYRHSADVNAVMNDYVRAMERAGWTELSMGEAAEIGFQFGVASRLYKRGQQKVHVNFTESPGGGTLVSIMVL